MTEDQTRRDVLKSMGAAGAATAIGIGSASAKQSIASETQVRQAVQAESSQIALREADVAGADHSVGKATVQEIDGRTWIQVTLDGHTVGPLSYNPSSGIGEVKIDDQSLVRVIPTEFLPDARPEQLPAENFEVVEGFAVEKLEMGRNLGTRALERVREHRRGALLSDVDARSINIEEAAANHDDISGRTRVFTPATGRDGNEFMALIILDGDEIVSTHALSREVSANGWSCWVNCVGAPTAGCTNVCSPCFSAPNKFTCAPCLSCVGLVGTICAIDCGV